MKFLRWSAYVLMGAAFALVALLTLYLRTPNTSDWWLVRLTGILALIGVIQTIVFGLQAYRLRQTIEKMDEIAKGQTTDMAASIGEASRAAAAMERLASATAVNVESLQRNLALNQAIAERQKLVTELAGRAYLSVAFNRGTYQDDHLRFEGQATVINQGTTPAYDVTFAAACRIVPYPPDDFDFPLADGDVATSNSLIAPHAPPKLITRHVAERVPQEEVDSIRHLGPNTRRCVVMYGIVNYRDAFAEARYTKFGFVIHWIRFAPGQEMDERGNPKPEPAMSADTARHNEAT